MGNAPMDAAGQGCHGMPWVRNSDLSSCFCIPPHLSTEEGESETTPDLRGKVAALETRMVSSGWDFNWCRRVGAESRVLAWPLMCVCFLLFWCCSGYLPHAHNAD